MTAVKIKGTFSKDEREGNGLEDISHDIVKQEFGRWVVVGIVEQHKVIKEPGEAPVPTIRFLAIEPLTGDAEDQGRQMLDQARKQRGLSLVAATLFDEVPFDGNKPAGWVDERIAGQQQLPDPGEREVPEPSAEEILAERDERKAAGLPAFSDGEG